MTLKRKCTENCAGWLFRVGCQNSQLPR